MNTNDELARSLYLSMTDKSFSDGPFLKSPHFLKRGSHGDVYTIDDDKVLKITSSPTEAYNAAVLSTDDSEFTIKIESVCQFVNDNAEPSFAYIMERLDTTIPDNLRRIFESSIDILPYECPDSIVDILSAEMSIGDRERKFIEELAISFNQMAIYGCYLEDLTIDNIGIKQSGTVVIIDQMAPDKVDRQIFQKMKEGRLELSEMFEAISNSEIPVFKKQDLEPYQHLQEITNAYSTFKSAMDTDASYAFLSNGDWAAGGCYAFAVLFKEFFEQTYPSLSHLPIINYIRNEHTNSIEHTYVSIGNLCIDGAGVFSKPGLMKEFSEMSFIPANQLECVSLHVNSNLLEELKHVDVDALRDSLDEEGLLPVRLGTDQTMAFAL